jgi:hypothetical protein
MSRRIELTGFLRPRASLLVSEGPRGTSAETVPRLAFRKAGSSSRELHSRSETLRFSPCCPCRVAIVLPRLATSRVQHLPWGLVPLRDVSIRSPRPTGFPHPTFGPPATFLASSTVFSSDCLAGLFHPATTSRVSLQGFPPTSQVAPTRRRRFPPRRWHRAPTRLPWRQLPARRPRGFVLTDDPQWPVR